MKDGAALWRVIGTLIFMTNLEQIVENAAEVFFRHSFDAQSVRHHATLLARLRIPRENNAVQLAVAALLDDVWEGGHPGVDIAALASRSWYSSRVSQPPWVPFIAAEALWRSGIRGIEKIYAEALRDARALLSGKKDLSALTRQYAECVICTGSEESMEIQRVTDSISDNRKLTLLLLAMRASVGVGSTFLQALGILDRAYIAAQAIGCSAIAGVLLQRIGVIVDYLKQVDTTFLDISDAEQMQGLWNELRRLEQALAELPIDRTFSARARSLLSEL